MVKCADCGYLTMRNRFSGELDEMDSEFRETGNPPQRRDRVVGGVGNRVSEYDTTPYHHVPLCFDQQCPLVDEIPASAEVRKKYPELPADMVLELITKDRDCPGFTPWQQGFTPKEHREMLDREKMLQWQRDREREDRKWRLIELFLFGIFATLVGAGAAILGAFIERGSWP